MGLKEWGLMATKMIMTIIILALALVLYLDQTGAQMPSQIKSDVTLLASPTKLIELAESERIGYEILQDCIQKLETIGKGDGTKLEENDENFLSIVNGYFMDYAEATKSLDVDRSSLDGKNLSEIISENPIASFLMMDRFRNKLTKIEALGTTTTSNDASLACFEYHVHTTITKQAIGWPTKVTVEEAANRILRIQHVYNFTAKDIIQGKLGDIDTGIRMPVRTLYTMGVIALDYSYYTLAMEWFDLAENRVTLATFDEKTGEKLTPPTLDEWKLKFLAKIKTKKLETIEKHDLTWERPNYRLLESGQYHFETPLVISGSPDEKKPTPRRTAWYSQAYRQIVGSSWGNVVQYWTLCSGHFNQTEVARSKLFCWLETQLHATFLIGPLKMEFLSRSPHGPDIVQIYEIFGSKKLNENLRASTAGRFEASILFSQTNLNHKKAVEARSSVHAVLTEKHYGAASQVSKTISSFTGYNLNGITEPLQIIQYSGGGHCAFHPDLNGPSGRSTSVGSDSPVTRIWTAMLYLSDVESGGMTVFQGTGMGTRPVKGSVVTWFNVMSDITLDEDNIHAGCPVILGTKYAANKWVPSGDQMFVRPCDLERRQRFRVPVNGVY